MGTKNQTTSDDVKRTRLRTRKRLSLYLTAFLLLFLSTLIWPLLAGPDVSSQYAWSNIGLQIAVCLSFTLWWLILASAFKSLTSGPVQVLWQVLLATLLFILLVICVLQIPGGLNEDYTPLTATAHLKRGLLGLLGATFAFVVLLRLRTLVRTRRQAGGRNWSGMLLSLTVSSLSVQFVASPELDAFSPVLQVILFVVIGGATVFYIAVNAFRVSWIGQLRGRLKLLSMLLGILLLASMLLPFVVFAGGPTGEGISVDDFRNYLISYSVPLSVFTLLSAVFGFLYALSSVLSLLFNIPGNADVRLTVDEMGVLDNMTGLMQSAGDVEEVAERIVEQTVEGFNATAAWIAVLDYDKERFSPEITAAHNISPKHAEAAVDISACFNEVAGSKEALVIQQVATDYRVRASLGRGMGSLAVVPLGDGADVSGALFIARDVAYGFEKDDIAAVRMLTSYASLALEYARLFESTIERERLARELAIAREVQLRLLPQELPEIAQLSMAASSSPAQEVGGDFYDMLELKDGKVALIVADVSGKGTSAAFYMAILQGIFRSAARVTPNPLEFLPQANQAISDCLDKKVFVTAIYGLIDQQSGVIQLARSGHCPAVLVNQSGESHEWRSPGLGLGLKQGRIFTESLDVVEHQFTPGDVVVLYTDGLIEHRDSNDEDYGAERLTAAIVNHRHLDAHALHDALIDDLAAFTGEQPSYSDDLTLMVLKWHIPEHDATVDRANQTKDTAQTPT